MVTQASSQLLSTRRVFSDSTISHAELRLSQIITYEGWAYDEVQ